MEIRDYANLQSLISNLQEQEVILLRTLSDEVRMQNYEENYVSAGERGPDIKLSVVDLMKVTRARFVDASS